MPIEKHHVTTATALAIMSYRSPPNVAMDVGIPLHAGGSGFYNFNPTEEDSSCVLSVLKEINCPCLFVVPMPTFGVYPYDGSIGMENYDERRFIAKIHDPDMMCVHQYPGGSRECRNLFKQLMIQEYTARFPGDTTVGIASIATSELERIMNKDK